MTFLDRKIPEYITRKRNTTRQVVFTAIFALVFINLYSPFGVDTWYELTRPQLLFYSSMVILTGLLIIAISRIIMHQVTKKQSITHGTYILWITAEIISLALVYLILQRTVISRGEDLIEAYKETLKITSLVLLFPYTLSYLYFSWIEKNRKLEELENVTTVLRQNPSSMIPFRDEKGELRFSLKAEDLLYLEAADNYVAIHYKDRTRKSSYMIRNSLKNMEESLRKYSVIRCHRSYMVNFDKVRIVRKERDGLVLELDTDENLELPISETYVDEVLRLFSKYPQVGN